MNHTQESLKSPDDVLGILGISNFYMPTLWSLIKYLANTFDSLKLFKSNVVWYSNPTNATHGGNVIAVSL